jgi:hypothetical protein
MGIARRDAIATAGITAVNASNSKTSLTIFMKIIFVYVIKVYLKFKKRPKAKA